MSLSSRYCEDIADLGGWLGRQHGSLVLGGIDRNGRMTGFHITGENFPHLLGHLARG